MQKLILTSFFLLSSSLFSSILSTKPIESSLIVYNGGIGLVHEKRDLRINRGDKEIIYRGVASTINTDSINITLPSSIKLYSQQYRFDKLTLGKLLDAHIGKKVVYKKKDTAKQMVTLLSHNSSNALVKDSYNMIISINTNDIKFKSIPTSLLTKPSLVWNIDAKQTLKTKMQIDYLIKNLSWKSDYILNLHDDEADLEGWITIDNHSGKAYKNTTLNVLAGDINRVHKPHVERMYRKNIALMQSNSPSVSHRSYEGYHFYSIPFKVNLANNEKTQIKFITQYDLDVKRTYTANLSNPLYLHSQSKHNVSQYIELQKLDIVLPKGIVRTYSELDGKNILLGENSLSHTPKSTPIKLKIGTNFDIKVKQSIQNRDDNKYYLDATVIYEVKNTSDTQKTVELLIPFNRQKTSTIKTSKPYSFKYGNQISFKINVDEQDRVSFKVNFRSRR
ncbi:MAG: hypothetical protein GXO30_09345 [Epsilonproteobacteria bacterium]|nr:hypothetical protein [Campylobacterota bacterium]